MHSFTPAAGLARSALCLSSLLCAPLGAVDVTPLELCRRTLAGAVGFEEAAATSPSSREAAQKWQAYLTATRDVIDRYERLKADPEFRGQSDAFLWGHAIDLVKARVANEGYRGRPAELLNEAFRDLAAKSEKIREQIVRGEGEFREVLEVFKDPAKHLKGPETTATEDYVLIKKALARLQKGDPSNATHVMDLILALENPAVRTALEAANVSPTAVLRDILLHDLGKQWNDAQLADYREFMKTVFPDGNFVNTQILPHEFASMILIAKLAKEAGIDPAKVPRLQALIANHNAGYNPKLAGFHWWVAESQWPAFAKVMQAAGIDLPSIYAPVMHQWQGGKPETVAFTSFDRGVSLTLATQEKFSLALVNQGKWNAESLAGQFDANVKGVPREMQSVLSRLTSYMGYEKANALTRAIQGYYVDGHAKRLTDLGQALRKMATEAPPPVGMSVGEEKTSVAYRSKDGIWSRVTGEGKVYRYDGKEWKLAKEGKKSDVPALFFREIVFPDIGYTPPQLALPSFLTPPTSP